MLHYLHLLISLSLPLLLRLAEGNSCKLGALNVLEIQTVKVFGIVLVINKMILCFSQVFEHFKYGIAKVREQAAFALHISSQDFMSFVFIFLDHT